MEIYKSKKVTYPWAKETSLLKIGELINHVLYGKEWMGIVLKIDNDLDVLIEDRKILVHMIPGTRYEKFFEKKWIPRDRVSDTRGWIYHRWVRRILLV
jgi:hypothetical protein